MKVLIPMNIDRWNRSIATQFRAVIEANPAISFYSFSSPENEEDVREGANFWKLPNVHKASLLDIFVRKFDIVQIGSFSLKNLLACILCKIFSFGKTEIVDILCVEIVKEEPNYWKPYKMALPFIDHFLSVSQAAGLRALEDAPEKYRGVIANGYHAPFYNRNLYSESDLPKSIQDAKKYSFILWVSSLEHRKNPGVLIALATKMPKTIFVAVGSRFPSQDENYYERISNLSNIVWLGLVDRVSLRALYGAAACLIFPSEREGLPLAVIEAMGMGLPVIAQAKSSLPDLVVNDVSGTLLSDLNLEDWANAVLRYLHLPDLERLELQRTLSSATAQKYDWMNVGRAYGEFYKKCLNSER